MAKSKKPKIIIRELKKNIKITEINKEEQAEEALEEQDLEEMAADAPSSRLFPSLQTEITPQEQVELPVNEGKKPENQGPVYNVQNPAEKEIRRVYESREEAVRRPGERVRNPMLLSSREERGDVLRNREIDALRRQQEEEEGERYEVAEPEAKAQVKRRYPWEA
jgi:hypothetical protein